MIPPPPYPFPERWAALAQSAQHGDAAAQRWLTRATPLSQYLCHHAAEPGMASPPAPFPSMAAPFAYYAPPSAASATHPAHAPTACTTEQFGGFPPEHAGGEEEEEEEEEEGEEAGEYEYGYVLRDEWRTYLRETVLSDGDEEEGGEGGDGENTGEGLSFSLPRRRQQRPAKTDRQPTKRAPKPSAVRLTSPLELALEDARALETQRQRERLAAVDDRDAWRCVDSMETTLHAAFEAFCDRHAPTVWPQGAS